MKNYNEKCTGRIYFSVACLLFFIVLSGCTYSFKGGSVPPHLKTVAIPVVEDQSGYGDPTLRNSFTQKLVEIFTNDNTLQLTDRNTADSMLECVITEVPDIPEVIQGGNNVTMRKITVTVRVAFQDLKLRKKVWEKSYSEWGTYPSGGGLTQRDEGVQTAIEKLTEDILNDTVAGW
jgi:Lipopolysaccharide-assembly